MQKLGSHFSAFVCGLVGILVGALLVTALPAGGASGSNMVLGVANKAGRTTELTSRGGSTLKLVNTAGRVALDLRVQSGTAPLAVNSIVRVPRLNADRLDGRHGSFYRNASNINTGYLAPDRFNAWQNLSDMGILDADESWGLLTRDGADDRYVNTNENAWNARNADLVDGFSASALVRVAHAETTDVNEATVFGGNHWGDVLTTQIRVPTRGLLFIVGSVDSGVTESGGGDSFYCQLHVDDAGVVGTARWVYPKWADNRSENCATNGVKEVAAGLHSVDLYVRERYTAVFADASLQVLYVPFGWDGSQP